MSGKRKVKKESKGYMFQCPECKSVVERTNSGGVVCETCHIFMRNILPMNVFEDDVEIKLEGNDG